jgi:hypothetical protein
MWRRAEVARDLAQADYAFSLLAYVGPDSRRGPVKTGAASPV